MLNSKAFGSALGILAGGFWFLMMGFSLLTGMGERTVVALGSFHPFFGYSFGGLIIIVIEHLIGGFIIGAIFAKLYNKFSR
ncbi:hypothetical protein HZB05_02570 [Candidatus Wolfebacteria bacterium]|nr:hypothetical protein [Candidatus Wolfebacteria bacterium]